MKESTICAIATSSGQGAISIVRVSGPLAIKNVNKITKNHNLEKFDSHTIHYGHIVDFEEKIVDEVLISIMKSPKTYTTEDTVEINCHGGLISANKIIELLLEAGCELAEPGEFTKRAFLNGRIDLVKAEAVSSIISSETAKAHELAINQLSGSLSEEIVDLRIRLMEILSFFEVNIDYPEYYDNKLKEASDNISQLEDIQSELEKLISESSNSTIINSGINIALVGAPNAGKSSLLNAFLGEEKAIVTDIAGTTRDIVEARIIIRGIPVNLIDTAGIHETTNVIEKIGIDKSLKALDSSDLIILVIDATKPITLEERKLYNQIQNKRNIVFLNKNDMNVEKINLKNSISGNTKSVTGIKGLKNRIIELFDLDKIDLKNPTYFSNARQIALLKQSLKSVKSAKDSIKNDMPIDIIADELREAWNHLGEIIGATYNEELLDNLFSKFCLGK